MASSPGFAYAGTDSPRLKAARRLAKRAFRDRDRAFLAEGPQAVAEALAYVGGPGAGGPGTGGPGTGGPGTGGPGTGGPGTGGPGTSGAGTAGRAGISDLFVTAPARGKHGDLVDAVAAAGVPVHLVNDAVMSELAQTVTPQGLLAVCGFVDVPLPDALSGGPGLVTVLANVRDPGNAGTVLRASDAAGAGAVIFADASVDPYNSKCVRASAGSLFHLPVVAGVRLAAAIGELRAAGLRVVAADGRAEHSLDEPAVTERLAGPTAWLFGNEAWGLPPELLALADEAVAVPIYGKAESLNLATAAAVCLYASARAQQVTGNSL